MTTKIQEYAHPKKYIHIKKRQKGFKPYPILGFQLGVVPKWTKNNIKTRRT